MVRHTLKILQHLLQDFYGVSDHFGILCLKVLIAFLVGHCLPLDGIRFLSDFLVINQHSEKSNFIVWPPSVGVILVEFFLFLAK